MAIMERYFTNTRNVELTDRLIESTMKTIINNVPTILSQHDNYDAWAEVMWAGTIAHDGLLSTGRVGDWGSHDIEHELSGIYDVAHGAGLAVVFPPWMKYVYKNDVNRFAQFAVRVWNIDNSFWDIERTAVEGIKKLESFFRAIGLPTTIRELGIEDDRLEEMAYKGSNGGTTTLGSFIKLGKEDIYNILVLSK